MFNRELFATRLKVYIHEQKLSLRQAAKQSGISVSTLSRLIVGNKVPDMEVFSKALDFTRQESSMFFTAPEHADIATRARIVMLLYHDQALPVEARESAVALVRAVYDCFARETENE